MKQTKDAEIENLRRDVEVHANRITEVENLRKEEVATLERRLHEEAQKIQALSLVTFFFSFFFLLFFSLRKMPTASRILIA